MAQDDFAQITCLDVCGCRKNALLTPEYLPVGSPLDTLLPVFDNKGQYVEPLNRYAWLWVDAKTDASHPLYDGPHLYPLETVQELMHEGFLVASADTLPFAWKPRRRFPSADLAHAWHQLERCCGGDGVSAEAAHLFAKTIILASIGDWTKQKRLARHARRTTHDADMPGPVRVTSFRPDGSTIKMCATELHDNRTMLPVALLCLFDEQRRMHLARQLVAKVPQIVPLGMQVDGLFYAGPAEADLALRRLAEAEKYEHSMASVFQFKQASWRQVPQCEQRTSHGRECHKPRLRLKWDFDDKEQDLEKYLEPLDAEALEQKALHDELIRKTSDQALPLLSDVSFAIADAAIGNGGMLCLGAAGCGKSVLLQQIKALLKGLDHKVRVCAYTHAACRMIGGETVAHLLHLNASLADTWVDEVGAPARVHARGHEPLDAHRSQVHPVWRLRRTV